jgi:hypothetical protein
MRTARAALLLAFVCLMNAHAQSAESFAAAWEKHHISRILPSEVRHANLKKYLEELKKVGVPIVEVGRSNGNREIFQVEFGRGPLKIFMWSQMHGDEPTATSALIDVFKYLQTHQHDHLVKSIAETMTIRAVPMLNPDGAEMFKRRNLQDLDINRDAINLVTPEGRLLKKLRDEWNPSIGFNLHNQNALTTVGGSPMQAAISLLVVYGDAEKTPIPEQERNTRIASAMVTALQKFIPGHIGRYDDAYAPNAFGDSFSAWGTPTILVETGALHGKDEMFLVKMNFVAFMTALQAIATGSEATQSAVPYLSLIPNGSGTIVSVIFRKANIVQVSRAVEGPAVIFSTGDIAGVTERRRASFAAPTIIRGVGSVGSLVGLEEYDASPFNVFQRFGRMAHGELAALYFYKKDRLVDWASTKLEKQFPPDAIYSNGRFLKGEGLVRRTRGN